jgi:hypothetical protein
MADPVTDPVAEHDARYGEDGAGPPEWARVRDRLARAGVAWFTTTRRAWTHGHGTRSTEKDGLDLGAETPAHLGRCAPERIRTPALLRYRIGGHAMPADYLSDRFGELGERRGDPQCGTGVDAEVVVGAAQVLDEGVAGNHDLRGPVSS